MEARNATCVKTGCWGAHCLWAASEKPRSWSLFFIQWRLEVCNICSSPWWTAISFKNSQSQILNVLFYFYKAYLTKPSKLLPWAPDHSPSSHLPCLPGSLSFLYSLTDSVNQKQERVGPTWMILKWKEPRVKSILS